MFTKDKVAFETQHLQSFDRIFIGASLLKRNEASRRMISQLSSALSNRHCVILSQKSIAAGASNEVIKQLLDAGVLVVNSQGSIVTVHTAYYNAAIELSKRKQYKLLLLTNDKQEGQAFVQLDYDDNHVNGLGACSVEEDGLYAYTYHPQEEYVTFHITTDAAYDAVKVLFYKSLNHNAFEALHESSDSSAFAKKLTATKFEYVIPKGRLFESDKVQFVACAADNAEYTSLKCDFYLQEKQQWQIARNGKELSARIVQKETEGAQSSIFEEGSEDEVPDSEKYPYFGGQKSKLMSDVPINVAEPKEGDVLRTNNEGEITLVKELGKGGEGVVYATDRDGVVCKIFQNRTSKNLTNNKKDKIEFMTKNPVCHPLIVWPIDAVYTQDNEFVGFTMKSAKGIELHEMIMQQKRTDGGFSKPYGIYHLTRTQLIDMIVSILDTLSYLHARNIIIGDIKMENFMIMNHDPTHVYFVDCDSYQIARFPATKVSQGYVPPELGGKRVDSVYRTFENEHYAVFALLFMLLHKGLKPYQQCGESRPEVERAREGIFPYGLTSDYTNSHAPRAGIPQWSHLPGYIKKAFYEMGSKRGSRFELKSRLAVKEWLKLFRVYQKDLRNGRLKVKDPECDVSVYNPFSDSSIDYALVDLPVEVRTEKTLDDVCLRSLIKKLLVLSKSNDDRAHIDAIEGALRRQTEYRDGENKFILKKNIGCYYRVEVSYLA